MNRLNLSSLLVVTPLIALLVGAAQAQNSASPSTSPSPRPTTTRSNNTTLGRPGMMTAPSQANGTQASSTQVGKSPSDGGSTEASSAAAAKQTPQPLPTLTDTQRGAAPAGASSEPKNDDAGDKPNSGAASGNTQSGGSRGSSANGGTAPMTGSRQDNPQSVDKGVGGSLPFMIPVAAVTIGTVAYFMVSAKNKGKRGS